MNIMLQDVKQDVKQIDYFDSMQNSLIEKKIAQVVNLGFPSEEGLRLDEMNFFRVEKLSYDKDYPKREAFENVLASLVNAVSYNFVYILTGTKAGIDLSLGIVKNEIDNSDSTLSTKDYGALLKNLFDGNFNGSVLKSLKARDLDTSIKNSVSKYKSAGIITGIPSINQNKNDRESDFQGIDRLINSMLGLEWRMVIVCQPVDKEEISRLQKDVYTIYDEISTYSKKTLQYSENSGESSSETTNSSDSKSKNLGVNETTGENRGHQYDGSSSGTSKSRSTSSGSSTSHTEGQSNTSGVSSGRSQSISIDLENKYFKEILKYIDEELLERLRLGYNKGLFKTSVYYMAENPTDANRLKSSILSIFQGDKSSYAPLNSSEIDLANTKNISILNVYQNQYRNDIQYNKGLTLRGIPFLENNLMGLSTYLTTKEVSLMAGLPHKEVPGIPLVEAVDFGLNQKQLLNDSEEYITMGNIIQKGRELEKLNCNISKKCLMKHTFIAGVTGSGKTTTCMNILYELNSPFLVIEPAKTEYRALLKSKEFKDDIMVFTLGDSEVAPFCINPFELVDGENLSSHVDMVKATFTSAFPMEASMPQILEEAIYSCYEKYGWNVMTSKNEKFKNPYDITVAAFPILSDLLGEVTKIVEQKGFANELKSNYIGSLVSRLSNLTKGSKGSILNMPHSTDFDYIVNNKVIMELENLKSGEDKALIMGFILARLSAVIRNIHSKNHQFKHITLIEEAHRLLSKVEYGDSGAKKNAVETFTDLLAEIRKYGEGFIIVDQIPNKLAPEVLKNTNTKIIHRLFVKDDKEAVGNAMLMEDKQKEYLSALEVGHAIIFSEETEKPLHIHIKQIIDTSGKEVENNLVKENFDQICRKNTSLVKLLKYWQVLKLETLYEKVVDAIRRETNAKELFENHNDCHVLNNAICTLEKELNFQKKEIFTILFNWWSQKNGKMIGDFEEGEKRTEIINWFCDVFSKNGVNAKDIPNEFTGYFLK